MCGSTRFFSNAPGGEDISAPDQQRCVRIFRRPDGLFSFDEATRVTSTQCWAPLPPYSTFCDTTEAAEREARYDPLVVVVQNQMIPYTHTAYPENRTSPAIPSANYKRDFVWPARGRTPKRTTAQVLWISVRRFVRPSSKPLIQARASRLSFS
jgi:hypothetical protein